MLCLGHFLITECNGVSESIELAHKVFRWLLQDIQGRQILDSHLKAAFQSFKEPTVYEVGK